MSDLPADVSPGDTGHSDHHDVLHQHYNTWRSYNPTDFVEVAAQAVNTQVGTAYTLTASDAGSIVEMDNASANTLTIPPGVLAVGTRVDVVQVGVGVTTITAGSGVTLRSNGAVYNTSGQWAVVSLYQRATNEWVLAGALTP